MNFEKISMENLGRINAETFKEAEKMPVIIILDNIRSAHNIGSIFRTSDAFRITAIYLTGICATPPHKELMKTALGAADTVPWMYFEKVEDAIRDAQTKGYYSVAVEQVTHSIYLQDFKPGIKTAFIFGNEVNGVSEEALAICDASLEIPQFGTKHSFNVSITTGIILWDTFLKLKTL